MFKRTFFASFLMAAATAPGLHAQELDGGDFTLDFVASAPSSYDHSTGGGAFDDDTSGVDTVESLQGGDFFCGERVSYLVRIDHDPMPTAPIDTTIQFDITLDMDTTGQSGAGLTALKAVLVNYGPVMGGDGPGGTDSAINDDGDSVAMVVGGPASGTQNGMPFTAGATLTATIQVTNIEPGATVIVRIDATIECDPTANPFNPTGNLLASLGSALTVPSGDTINTGGMTIPFMVMGLDFPDCDDDGVPDADEEDCDMNGIPDDCEDQPDCNMNGIPDLCETGPDCNGNGIPDDCEPDCDGDGVPDDCELDCDGDGLPDDCEPDCDGDGMPDDCEPDCDGDGTPDDCEPDCDGDGTPDDCEPDCDGDGTPDDCEPDCDGDGTPDDCEPDCDSDGLPDDCEPDCDDDGIPDDCEPDCDDDGIPDDCEVDCDDDGIPDDCGDPCDLDCVEFDRNEHLTPLDTLTLLTRVHNPDHFQGYLYAYAIDEYGDPVGFDHLIGNLLVVDGMLSLQYSVNPVDYRARVGQGVRTDLDGDGVRDLDGLEYERTPGELLFPRFLGQGQRFNGELVMIDLAGGAAFDTTLGFLIYNDNEDQFSAQHTFTCWDKVPLLDISQSFGQVWLRNNTGNNPQESLGGEEYGWFRMEGQVANSYAATILDPAVYGVYVERVGSYSGADLPFEACAQSGHLLPRTVTGDNSEDGSSTRDCSVEPPSRRLPASLLLYPEFDNRQGTQTVLTVTNTDRHEAIDVHFVYRGRYGR